MAGDKVQLNVANYYDGSYNAQDDQPVTANNLLGSIVSVLTGGAGGLGTSESHNPELVPRLFNSENYAEMEPLLHGNADPTRPKAFLNYVLFDANMQVVRTFTGAFQANGNGGWQTIGNTEPMTIPENGYLAVYLSNASDFSGCSHCLASEGDVYFDHLEITFTHGHLQEENGYYPYGLPMAGQSSTALGMTPNRQKYQSNEYITEAGLNWMSFGARQYDPALGRFLSVDPLAAAGGQESNSPYEAMGDEPVSETDPGGMQPRQGRNLENPNFEIPLPAGFSFGGLMGINPANLGLESTIDGLNNMVMASQFQTWIAQQNAQSALDKTTGDNQSNKIYVVSSGYSKEELKKMGAYKGSDGNWYTWIETTPGDLSSLTKVSLIGGDHVLTTYYNSDGSINYHHDEISSLDVAETITDATGTALGVQNSVLELGDESLKGLGFVRGMKFAGYGVSVASGLIDAGEVIETGELKPSNVLDIIVTGATFIPIVGDALAGAYFLSDLITEGITGETIEEHLDNSSWGQNHTYPVPF